MFGPFRRHRPRPAPAERAARPDAIDGALARAADGGLAPALARLDAAALERLHGLATRFVATRRFEGAGGLDPAPELIALVAVEACLPVLNLPGGLDACARVRTVVLYPSGFVARQTWTDEDGVEHEREAELAGEAWDGGPVVLAADDVEASGPGFSVVVHEMAHVLDAANGAVNGFPDVTDPALRAAWPETFDAAWTELAEAVERGESGAARRLRARGPGRVLRGRHRDVLHRSGAAAPSLAGALPRARRVLPPGPGRARLPRRRRPRPDAPHRIRRVSAPLHRTVTCCHPGGLHRVAYREWVPAGAPPDVRTVLCVHGLTRSGRDFDPLAGRLVAEGLRVVCPDMAGRGDSDPLPAGSMYEVPRYVADCVTLVARLGVERVDWVGTSMGGLVGMVLGSLPGHPIGRLLVNDIGPVIEPTGLERIRGYVGANASWDSFEAAEAALRETMRDFGPHTDEQFAHLSRHHFRRHPDGRWRVHHDPAIAEPILAGGTGAPDSLWGVWDAIDCPVTVLRGADSDVLSDATLETMAARKPGTGVERFEGVGHAPTLIAEDQVAAVLRFLGAGTIPG